jgi:hypothetical protein
MAHSRSVDADGMLITVLSGVVTLEELMELEKELPRYMHEGSIYELVLHSDDIEISINRYKANSSAKTVKEVMKGIRKGAIAFVSDRDYIFGLCRRMEMLVENERIKISVFRSEETARKWLHEMRSFKI